MLVVRALAALPHVFAILGTIIRYSSTVRKRWEESPERRKAPLWLYSFRVSVLITRRVAWYWQQECGKGRSHGNGPGG